jgi:hypothetical protein
LPKARGLFELSFMTQAERHALKLRLHEDVRAIAFASLEETTKTPKLFDGAPLPIEPTECLRSVNALIRATEERLFGLRKARRSLERMVDDVEASTRVLNGSRTMGLRGGGGVLGPIEAEALTARFTELPPPTDYEKKMTTMVTMMMTPKKDEDEDEQKQNNHKRAKTSSSSSGLCSACQCCASSSSSSRH